MKDWTDLPRGVTAEKPPPAEATLSKPLRAQYPKGVAGHALYARDLQSWNSTRNNTPSPGFTGKKPSSPQRSAVQRMMRNQGFDWQGEDK